MSEIGSLQRRAALAIALTIGFYLLALSAAAALLLVTYAQLFWADSFNLRLVLFTAIPALAILWSILPRIDRFGAPGPLLKEEDQPELFAVLRDVAAATRQEMPAEVYLIPDVNAYVAHRGGLMGIGRRRIMGIGLTLMESVSVAQFRAIIAHEFGHYVNDDVKFGAWIYKTRAALERTVHHLEQHSGWLHVPFRWYGKQFIRITQAVSRAQELAADRLAASVAGAKNAISALVAIQRAGFAYHGYMDGELAPVLVHGYRPPVAAGFTRFAASVAKSLDQAMAESIEKDQTDVDDTHPPLRERVAALGEMPQENEPDDAPRATTLLRGLAALEAELLVAIWNDPAAARTFQSVAWEETGTRVFVPMWRQSVTENAEKLRGVSAANLAAPIDTLVRQSREPYDDAVFAATHVVGSALSARLHDLGWMCDATPGRPIAFTRDGRTIEPFNVVAKLQKGEITAEAWAEECRAAGVDGPLV